MRKRQYKTQPIEWFSFLRRVERTFRSTLSCHLQSTRGEAFMKEGHSPHFGEY